MWNRYTQYDFRLFIDELSEKFPEVKDYALELIRDRQPVKMLEAIERITSEPGGATYSEISRRTGFSVQELKARLHEMRKDQLVHVCGWKKEPGHTHKKPIYAFGAGENVPYPREEKTTKPLNLGQPKPATKRKRVSKPLDRAPYRAKVRVQRDPAASWF